AHAINVVNLNLDVVLQDVAASEGERLGGKRLALLAGAARDAADAHSGKDEHQTAALARHKHLDARTRKDVLDDSRHAARTLQKAEVLARLGRVLARLGHAGRHVGS